MNELIKFSNVSYSVGDTEILKGINGSIPEGKITTLVGPSGAGKTTLFRLCNALISPTSGEIFIKGRNIDNYDPVDLRRRVGLALQSATMISGTVWKNLALPLTLQGKKIARG